MTSIRAFHSSFWMQNHSQKEEPWIFEPCIQEHRIYNLIHLGFAANKSLIYLNCILSSTKKNGCLQQFNTADLLQLLESINGSAFIHPCFLCHISDRIVPYTQYTCISDSHFCRVMCDLWKSSLLKWCSYFWYHQLTLSLPPADFVTDTYPWLFLHLNVTSTDSKGCVMALSCCFTLVV